MKKLYKNWVVHNLISHPLSEVVYWVCILVTWDKNKSELAAGKIHDFSLPEHVRGTGRG